MNTRFIVYCFLALQVSFMSSLVILRQHINALHDEKKTYNKQINKLTQEYTQLCHVYQQHNHPDVLTKIAQTQLHLKPRTIEQTHFL